MSKKAQAQVTTVQEPPITDPERAPYTPENAKARRGNGGKEDPNGQPEGEDHVFSVASRDRWAGADSATLAEQHADSRKIDAGTSGDEEEEEEEEESSSADMTVAELKAALDEAGVEYETGAKKADLVALYDAQ